MKKGLTLVEVLVASLLMTIVVLGVMTSLTNYNSIVVRINNHYIADNIANEFIEQIRETHSIPTYTNPITVKDLFGADREYQLNITDNFDVLVTNTGQAVTPKLNSLVIQISWGSENVSYYTYYEK